MSASVSATDFPLRGRIHDIRRGMRFTQVEVATDYGVLATTVAPATLDELELTVGADVVARVVASGVLLSRG